MQHLHLQSLGKVISKRDHITRGYRKRIREAGIPGLKKVYLFGSCARGEVRSSSDVDLLVYTEHRLADRELAAWIRWTLDEPV
ncbi:MAG TPA: hypothetical protein DF613_08340, partial [Lachnospiraceae bacterium]|nr:hypothetical protein [Lachnospiraceae bacterium]